MSIQKPAIGDGKDAIMSDAEEDCCQADCFQTDKSSDKTNDDIIPYSVLLIKNIQGRAVSKCVHGNGPEFVGQEFQTLLEKANSIIKAVHKTVGSVIRTLVHLHEPHSVHEAEKLVDQALATAMHATQCAANQSLMNHSPGAIAFHRDMILDILIAANMIAIQANRQKLIDYRLLEANAKRVNHDFHVGQQVMKKNVLSFSDKLKPAYRGPYPITQVHTNGTVTIALGNNATKRINIRRIKPVPK